MTTERENGSSMLHVFSSIPILIWAIGAFPGKVIRKVGGFGLLIDIYSDAN